MNHDALPPFGWSSLLHHWSVPLGWLLVCLFLLGVYGDAVIRGRARGARTSWWRVGSFVAGVVVLLFAVSSAIEAYAMALFWVHMIQHLLLIMVVPILLVLGHPLATLRAALAERGQRRFDAVLHAWPVAIWTHPLVGLIVYGVVVVGTHLTGFMDQMVEHGWLGTGEQVAYVVSGYLFLLPLLGREPIRWQVPYLARVLLSLVGMVPDTIVGIVLLQSGTLAFPEMFGDRPSWAPSGLQDQQIGGGLMWAVGDGLMMVIGVIVVIAMISDRDRTRVLGSWLENTRRRSIGMAGTGDVDDDEDALAAYNAMLARMREHS